MNNKITITASDGKVLTGTLDNYAALVKEVNAYEANLKLKKQKEQEERAKAVAAQKAKEEAKEYRYNQVLDKLESLNKVVESYEKETGEKLEYLTVNDKLEVRPYGYMGTFTGIPVIGLSTVETHNNWWNQLYEELRHNF
jgi:phosphoribulokinase